MHIHIYTEMQHSVCTSVKETNFDLNYCVNSCRAVECVGFLFRWSVDGRIFRIWYWYKWCMCMCAFIPFYEVEQWQTRMQHKTQAHTWTSTFFRSAYLSCVIKHHIFSVSHWRVVSWKSDVFFYWMQLHNIVDMKINLCTTELFSFRKIRMSSTLTSHLEQISPRRPLCLVGRGHVMAPDNFIAIRISERSTDRTDFRWIPTAVQYIIALSIVGR